MMKKIWALILTGCLLLTAAAGAFGEENKIWQRGDSGDEVRWIQTRLQELNYSQKTPDGVYDEETEAAVLLFQQEHDLLATGMVDSVTWKVLEQETDERLRAEEMRKRSEAQARNLDALQKNMLDSVELRMRLTELRTALRAKEQEIAALEDGLTLELAGKAAKLAVLHHLSIVYASPMTAGLPIAGIGTDPVAGLRVISGTAIDLTEELAQEIEKDKKTDKQSIKQ